MTDLEPIIAKIAAAFHDEYEAFAEANGWETQKRSRVAFEDLPAENRATMISTVRALIDRGVIRIPAATPIAADRNESLVQRIRDLARPSALAEMSEAMEDPVIAESVRTVEAEMMYLGMEDAIHSLADEVASL